MANLVVIFFKKTTAGIISTHSLNPKNPQEWSAPFIGLLDMLLESYNIFSFKVPINKRLEFILLLYLTTTCHINNRPFEKLEKIKITIKMKVFNFNNFKVLIEDFIIFFLKPSLTVWHYYICSKNSWWSYSWKQIQVSLLLLYSSSEVKLHQIKLEWRVYLE